MKKLITLLFAIFTVQLCIATCPGTASFSAVNSPSGIALYNVDFTNTSTVPSGYYVSYSIDFGDGSSSPVLTTVAHNYAGPGSFTATMTMTVVDSGVSTCTNVVTVPVTVTAPPCGTVITPTVLLTYPTGEVVSFSASAPPGGAFTTYSWDFGDGSGTSSAISPMHTYAANGTYLVTLNASGGPCGPGWTTTAVVNVSCIFDCTVDVISSVNVVQAASPDKTISYNVGYTLPPTGQHCDFLWTFGDGTTSVTASGTHTYLGGYGPYTVSVDVKWIQDSTSIPGCTKSASTTITMIPVSSNRISGEVRFPVPLDSGITVTVWLISYNSTLDELSEVTRVLATSDGTGLNYYYEFISQPTTANYYIKASVNYPVIPVCGCGYVPTYYVSSPLWLGATSVPHLGTEDNRDIIMSAPTAITSIGPGFIPGNVTTGGAGKRTAGPASAAGILMLLKNLATGQIVQNTYTDADGNYAFNNLPLDQTYYVYPELINYSSIPYSGITLTSGTPSAASANFVKHDVSKTILPSGPVGVKNVNASGSSVVVFPNPSAGQISVQWQANVTEEGKVTIMDVTGREVYSETTTFTQGSGTIRIDLSGVDNGLYIISVRSATLQSNHKIQISH